MKNSNFPNYPGVIDNMGIAGRIRTIPLFKGLTDEQYDDLAMIVNDQEIKRGQVIFLEGDKGVGFYVIISGLVKIYKLSLDGKEQILHILGPGEPFAEAAVFAGSTYPAHAITIEKSSILFFPRDAFIDLINKNPSLAMNMMATLSRRLKKFAHMIEELSLKEVPGRLAAHLLVLSGQQDNSMELRLKISKSHLAGLLGTIPETLSRILSKMVKQGLIKSSGAIIKIIDQDGLKELAEGVRRLG